MAAIQLSFSLRVSSGVKSVHLLGSWDHYAGQLPLSRDRRSSSKSGTWKATFRFQGATLVPGQRYWYYYIIDGYHVSHDPARASTTEPTTGRALNILDVPYGTGGTAKTSSTRDAASSPDKYYSRHDAATPPAAASRDKKKKHDRAASGTASRRDARRSGHSAHDIPKGRPLSISQIKSPRPVAPHATRHILEADYGAPTVEELTSRFSATTFGGTDYAASDDYYDLASSPPSSAGSSLSSRSDDSSSPSSASSLSDYSSPSPSSATGLDDGGDGNGEAPANMKSCCSCERYGITRRGDRVRLDCGGSRCGGYSDDEEASSCCSSLVDEQEYIPSSARRHGIIVRR